MSYRKRISANLYFVADNMGDDEWKVRVVDSFEKPVEGAMRRKALFVALTEISSLRSHIWHKELNVG